jgi:Putative enzyme of poly-gamma-glutamate biosynthesis (capsule formation)
MKVLIAGDFCPQNRVAKLFEQQSFQDVLGEVKNVTSLADISLVNFECAVVKGDFPPIKKCGSSLKCGESGVEALKWCGFDVACLANNHIRDFGDAGVDSTVKACLRKDVGFVGGGNDLDESSKTLFVEVKGEVLAVINCCEHEFSIATSVSGGANPLDPLRQYQSIKDAKRKADFVLVIIHGGHEHFQLPSPRMQDTYRFFIEAGADAVVNHHQHCFTGYEVYRGCPIFYGLGNFCFDKGKPRDKKWHEGLMIMLDLEHQGHTFEIIPYNQCEEEPHIELIKDKNRIVEEIRGFNMVINNRELLNKKFAEYCNESMREINLLLEPISNRLVRALQQRHYLPKYPFGQKYILRLYNIIHCEAHRDKVLAFLNNEYQKCEQ